MAQQEQLETAVVEIARAAAVLFREERMPVGVSVWYSDGFVWQSGLGCEPLNPTEWEPLLAETLRAAVARTRHNRCRPLCVTVWLSDLTCLQLGLPAAESWVARDAGDLSQCKQDITKVLHDKNRRLTTSQILQELRGHDFLWGESTVKRALAEMVRDHELTNRRDVRPRGYGLPAWV